MLGARERRIKIPDLPSKRLWLKGETDNKDSYKCILLSCILAVSARHNGNLEGTALDVPEAIRESFQKSHT